jgi:hypothetical protein
MTNSDLKPGDMVVGVLQHLNIPFTVSEIEGNGPYVRLKHEAGEVDVRKQDIKDKTFRLEVKRRA